ncbi:MULTISPECIES: DUF427 domain-containing protein [unclassified Microbacterium]|uniref:DUF427 domain-containing protein n=1 Tax=unclassified Microbacterium TaxID=2609290 RepID=UPI0012FA5D15|nr:DUF427 domain-containing protein [Microbacterium sp. MAH-37]MVQ41290.1 DUF427 domain-containing protein [Microbacterium sp. MAH-37]
MKAVFAGTVLADAGESELVLLEGDYYFPPASVHPAALVEGAAFDAEDDRGPRHYLSAVIDGEKHADIAWSYPEPSHAAIARAGVDFTDFVAFGPEVEVRS